MTRARNIAGFSTITTTPSPVHVGPIGVLTATRIDGEFNVVDIATRDLTAQGIGVTNLQVSGITTGLNVSGIITAQNGINFNGTSTGLNVSGVSTITTLDVNGNGDISGNLTVGGNATISGNTTIAGVLTYEDVTRVDSVGVVTARGLSIFGNTTGLQVASGISTFQAVTGTTGTFSGAVSGTTGTFSSDVNVSGELQIADYIVHIGDGNTALRFPSADTITAQTDGTERLRITSDGHILNQGLTSPSFVYSSTKVLEVSGDGTVGNSGVINVSGNVNSSAAVGSIRFNNRENTASSSGSSANSRNIASIDVFADTSDSNAGDDCGGLMRFITKADGGGNAERLRITSDGKVGIGITNPAEKFEVKSGNIAIVGGAGYKIDTHPLLTTASFTDISGGSYAARLGSTGSSTIRSTQIYGGGNHIATFDGVNYRLGIYETAPDASLHISHDSSPTIRLENTDTSLGSGQVVGNVEFKANDPSGIGAAVIGSIESFSDSSVGGSYGLKFKVSTSSSANYEAMRIAQNGYVSLGGQVPDAHFHIEKLTPELRLQSTNANLGQSSTVCTYSHHTSDPTTPTGVGEVFRIKTISANANGADYSTELVSRAGSGGGESKIVLGQGALGNITFSTNTSGSATERLRIDSSGRVSIASGAYGGGGTTPELYVRGTSGRQMKIHNSDAGTSSLQITNATTGEGEDAGPQLFTQGGTGDFHIQNAYATGDIAFGTKPSGGSTTERLRIDSGGRVKVNLPATNGSGSLIGTAQATVGTKYIHTVYHNFSSTNSPLNVNGIIPHPACGTVEIMAGWSNGNGIAYSKFHWASSGNASGCTQIFATGATRYGVSVSIGTPTMSIDSSASTTNFSFTFSDGQGAKVEKLKIHFEYFKQFYV